MGGLSRQYKGLSGKEPTSSDLGAVQKAGDTMTGVLGAPQFRPSTNRETLSGNKTIAATDPQFQFLNPGGSARDVTLPSAATDMIFVVKNTGTLGNNLTVKDSGGTAITGGVIANGISMGFCYDGTAWQTI